MIKTKEDLIKMDKRFKGWIKNFTSNLDEEDEKQFIGKQYKYITITKDENGGIGIFGHTSLLEMGKELLLTGADYLVEFNERIELLAIFNCETMKEEK